MGDWLVYPELDRVVHGGRTVHLEPRVMELLVFLAAHPGRVLAKEALIDAVWPQRFVQEAALVRAVAKLRRALGDDSDHPRYVETIPKRGYRLVAEVVQRDSASPAPAPAAVPGAACVLVLADRTIRLRPGENLIGRSPDAQVQVALARVSRHHARLLVDASGARIEDLGSKNGTFVNGERIATPTPLSDGDEIQVGRATLVFRVLAAAPTETDHGEPTGTLDQAPREGSGVRCSRVGGAGNKPR